MQRLEAVEVLAGAEARRVRCFRSVTALLEDETGGGTFRVPYVTIEASAPGGRLRASGHRCEGHDNEARMPYVCDWLNRCVLPRVDPACAVGVAASQSAGGAALRLELHDSYSYLPGAREYRDCLTFARPRHARESVALLPDPYQTSDYGGLLHAVRAHRTRAGVSVPGAVAWEAKMPRVLFAGTTTGDRDPAKNERIAACVWARAHAPDIADMWITSIAQMEPSAAHAAVPGLRHVLRPPVQPADHWAYRYVANLAGNTCCWSRLPMILASSSLCVDVPPAAATVDAAGGPDMNFWHPLLHDGEHFVSTPLERLRERVQECEADPARCKRMVASANRFADGFLTADVAAVYARRLIEGIED
jgi:hypothetical protein